MIQSINKFTQSYQTLLLSYNKTFLVHTTPYFILKHLSSFNIRITGGCNIVNYNRTGPRVGEITTLRGFVLNVMARLIINKHNITLPTTKPILVIATTKVDSFVELNVFFSDCTFHGTLGNTTNIYTNTFVSQANVTKTLSSMWGLGGGGRI